MSSKSEILKYKLKMYKDLYTESYKKIAKRNFHQSKNSLSFTCQFCLNLSTGLSTYSMQFQSKSQQACFFNQMTS